MSRPIAIIGFMAAGKTTIGRRLAKLLAREFVDTDAVITAKYGPIQAIFASQGEAAFRRYECEVVAEVLIGERVVSLGGGAITYAPTRALIAERAYRVFIETTPAFTLERLNKARVARPLAGDAPTVESLAAIFAERLPFYREANLTINGDGRTSTDLARELAERLA